MFWWNFTFGFLQREEFWQSDEKNLKLGRNTSYKFNPDVT